MALNKLRGKLVAFGIKQHEVAKFLGMTTSNFNRKLAEAVPFTCDEMFAIRGRYFPEKSIDCLFQSDGNKPTKAEITGSNPVRAAKSSQVRALFALACFVLYDSYRYSIHRCLTHSRISVRAYPLMRFERMERRHEDYGIWFVS